MGILEVSKGADQNRIRGVRITEISLLRGHEGLDTRRLCALQAEIKSDGILKKPIAADVNTNVVLDGHHRIGALKLLGCSKIPVLFVDYQSPKIGVKTAENGIEYPKQKVIEAALRGKLLPPKSTWHYVMLSNRVTHISKMQKRVDVPLSELK